MKCADAEYAKTVSSTRERWIENGFSSLEAMLALDRAHYTRVKVAPAYPLESHAAGSSECRTVWLQRSGVWQSLYERPSLRHFCGLQLDRNPRRNHHPQLPSLAGTHGMSTALFEW